ncbi:hypothetical protein [Paraburkholderia dinghuensis]|uniref:Uncharacterized protein n=1 Tax=Paraburkholderia dinghuensis TaxID=2305225 RepID=A0A3N6Q4C1_9BURK|nr:hypothetical protein [Paraburkholderia dinghuensis]RQH10060.1 hypothetical protein D1Y85_02710 [Paraburkholderia dinghuensis]
MSVTTETRALRRQLNALAVRPDWALLTRHDLLRDKPASTLAGRVWWRIRRLLASGGLMAPHVTPYPWLPTLKHRVVAADVKTLVIWAPAANRDELRAACEGFSKKLSKQDSPVPVLVTEVADFAFYSRLGWLVEYLPELSGDGPCYRQRKQAYLAWRYCDACIVPLSAGLASESDWHALLKLSGK